MKFRYRLTAPEGDLLSSSRFDDDAECGVDEHIAPESLVSLLAAVMRFPGSTKTAASVTFEDGRVGTLARIEPQRRYELRAVVLNGDWHDVTVEAYERARELCRHDKASFVGGSPTFSSALYSGRVREVWE